jgi:superfamily I DNA/RNA helicase
VSDEDIPAARAQSLQLILDSDARHKVIAAGPGTGKSYTFRRVLEQVEGNPLILTFLNNLVADLNSALGDQADVSSFHGFARGLLHRIDVPGISRDVDYYPPLQLLIEEDLRVTHDATASWDDLERAYMYLDDSSGIVSAGLRIGDYYDAVGYTDSVFRVYSALRHRPELIPVRSQLLVDEYQDFSLLEASLIDLLATRSPTLIVGDDDQALYGFKHAAADYLRDLVKRPDYERFELPYCSRCTTVLVEATHQIVRTAVAMGLLKGRIDKPYLSYLPDKRADSARYPRIIHARCSVERNNAPYVCRYVAEQIRQVSAGDVARSRQGGHPTVLVIGPVQFVRRIFQHLEALDLPNVDFRTSTELTAEALDAYRRLAKDERSRLGWRILLYLWHPSGWEKRIRRAILDGDELFDLLDNGFRERHLRIASLLARILRSEEISSEDQAVIETAVGLPLAGLRKQLGLDPADEGDDDNDVDKPTIVLTSLLGAKGLQAEHVFVVGVNEGHFPLVNASPTDDEVCCLLVALTRARQSCSIVSCNRFGNHQLTQGVFIQWLRDLIETRTINAQYWTR